MTTAKVGDIQRVMGHYRVDQATARRALALAPASALLPQGTAADGVTVPSWLLFLGFGFGFGMVLGPAVMASTDAGAKRLAEMAKARIG